MLCFPHAGGAASAYHRWGNLLPVEVLAVQLPGREGRLNERPMSDLNAVTRAVVDAMTSDPLVGDLDRPFTFFGHSMGSLLAYETILEMRRRGLPLPASLMVSGRAPPDHVPDEELLHPLPDDTFISELDRRFGGLPAILRDEPELMALFLPVLRADLTMLERHVYEPQPPIDVPMRAYGGLDDVRAPRHGLDDWSRFTTDWRGTRQFPGGHFYLHDAGSALPKSLSADLEAILAAAA
ncbi:MAG TPA: alpha/beta fold hydrolase [Saliniramus sp.]|nr:alpha/beta fold hydrolase [Saliniramus sp.]